MLAVTATLAGSELLVALGEANDTAILQVEGGSYAVREGAQTVGTFPLAAVDSIRVTGDAAKSGQMLFIKPGGVVADGLTVEAGVEATVVNAPIVTSGSVNIASATITLAENVSSAGDQSYAGLVRLSNDVVLDAGAGLIAFGSEIRSTVGPRATLMEDLGAPNRLAAAPGGSVLYASDAVSNYVYFIDLAAQQLDTVDLGKSMGHVALSSNGSRLYVANPLDGSVSVVDTTSRAAVATIAVPGTPEGMAFSPDGQTLYVANYSENSVAVINAATNRLTRTIPVDGNPTAVAVAADGRLWVASEVLNRVSVVDAATATVVAEIAVGRGPADIAISPDGTRAYVANNFDGTVSVIDTATEAVTATIGVGSGPTELVATPDGRRVYVVNGFSDSVSVIDTGSLTVATTASVGSLPVGLALSADGNTAYVANLNSLSELGNDARSLTVRTTGTARFGAPPATVDPLRQLTVEAGQQVGPPLELTIIEAVGGFNLGYDGAGLLYTNGTMLTLGAGGVDYHAMKAAGWRAVAAETVGSVNTLVWRHASGNLRFWRFSESWSQQGDDGWQAPGSGEFYATEIAFTMDFNGDGVIGPVLTEIESVGGVTLGRDGAGSLFANGVQMTLGGNPVDYDAMDAAGWQAVAADTVDGVNTLVWRHASGNLHFWRFSSDWAQQDSDGWQGPRTGEFYATEIAFTMDFNGDDVIGAALTEIESVGGVTLARDEAGSLFANGVQMTLGGNPVNYDAMNAAGWQAVAAETVGSVNTLVWRHASGNLRFWRFSESWSQQGDDGWQAPGSGEFYATETAFGMDFNSDGVIGAALTTIESVGSVTLAYDRAGNLFANGTMLTLGGNPVDYHAMNAAGWRAVAAENIDGVNSLAWRHDSGNLHFWRLSDSWAQQSADGWLAPDSSELYASERGFGSDLNDDGVVGGPLTVIENVGAVWLSYDDAGHLFANATKVTLGGNPVDYNAMNDLGWRAVAAEAVEGVNTIVWRHASGALHFWRLSDAWAQDSSDGWLTPGTAETRAAELAFEMDLNDNGFLG